MPFRVLFRPTNRLFNAKWNYNHGHPLQVLLHQSLESRRSGSDSLTVLTVPFNAPDAIVGTLMF